MHILDLLRRALAAITVPLDRCWRCRQQTAVPGDMITGLALCSGCRELD